MGRADVRSIQALADLRSTLLRFGAETEAALRAMDAQVRQTLKYLSERQRYWEVQVSAAEEEYKRARAALQACQSRRHIDSRTGRSYAPPCTQENQRVLRASLARAKAQDQLRQVLNWRRLVENSAKEYQREAGRMADWLRQELPKASGLLENKVNTLYDYTSSRPGGAPPFDSATFTTQSPADVTARIAALLMSPPPEGIDPDRLDSLGLARLAILDWLRRGPWQRALGDVGEMLAADLAWREGNLCEIPFDPPYHGFDRIFLTPDGRVVILESKVHTRGKFYPGQTQHGEQGSPEWIAAQVEKMADPSSAQWSPANECIAALIREVGPERTPVVAVVIETETGQAHIYHRQGDAPWTPLQKGISLGEVLSTEESPPTPRPGGLERESSPEAERGGGPEN
ncbi:MAG: hypothetical protein KatS3mg050_2740 [Litorilinea sp.]|nr:MAG: hypothetical protein KatS3mg050_2740 [Litorilinea sp.]